MQRSAGISIIAAILSLSFAACRQPTIRGEGATKTEARQTNDPFTSIEIDAPVDGDIRIVPGSTPSINLDGYANVLPYIKIKIEDGKLKIYTQDDINIYTGKNVIAHITLPSIKSLEIAGSSDSKISGNVSGSELKVDMAGAGSVIIDSLNVSLLDVDMAGSSEITIKGGNTVSTSYDVAGSGDIHAFNLVTTDTDIEIAGSGSAEVNATGKLNVSISGSGDVVYKGNPSITKDVAGSGNVEQAK